LVENLYINENVWFTLNSNGTNRAFNSVVEIYDDNIERSQGILSLHEKETVQIGSNTLKITKKKIFTFKL